MNTSDLIGSAALAGMLFAGGGCIGSPAAVAEPSSSGGGEAVADSNRSPAENATYEIEGRTITLVDGEAVEAPGSDLGGQGTYRYLGDEAIGDLNGDGRDDRAVILAFDPSGTGVFYYAAAVIAAPDGYGHAGTNGMLLGDRVAPQSLAIDDGVVTVGYADRLPGEPMTAAPTAGKSLRLRLADGRLVEIAGEGPGSGVVPGGPAIDGSQDQATVSGALSEAEAQAIAEAACIKGGEALAGGFYNAATGTWWFDANLNATKPGCRPACVVSEATGTAEVNWRCTGLLP
jgi:hypothetical protein